MVLRPYPLPYPQRSWRGPGPAWLLSAFVSQRSSGLCALRRSCLTTSRQLYPVPPLLLLLLLLLSALAMVPAVVVKLRVAAPTPVLLLLQVCVCCLPLMVTMLP